MIMMKDSYTEKSPEDLILPGFFQDMLWQRAIFPGRLQPSIVAADTFHFCVRNGYRWDRVALSPERTLTTAYTQNLFYQTLIMFFH